MNRQLARFNMIEQQIRPWDVLDTDVLELLGRMRREEFVAPAYQNLAFSDLEVPIIVNGKTTGETMLSPKVEARMLQELAPRKHERILEIGAGSGYMAALLGHRAREVISLEIRPELVEFAKSNLRQAGLVNVQVTLGDGAKTSHFTEGDFDAIVVSGSLAFVPPTLLNLLKDKGRLIAIVGNAPVLCAELIEKHGAQRFASKKLFETSAKPLSGFPIQDRFSF